VIGHEVLTVTPDNNKDNNNDNNNDALFDNVPLRYRVRGGCQRRQVINQ
jgi:hypothetical protein